MNNHWTDTAHIQQQLEQAFKHILHTRMHDMPLLNTSLQVQALPFQQHNEDWVGCMLTPWFMNLMLLPITQQSWQSFHIGDSIIRRFPSGTYQFTVAEDSLFGQYASCSLYSPMFQFQHQQDAETAAKAVMQALFLSEQTLQQLAEGSAHPPKTISRRGLLSARFNESCDAPR